MTELVKLLTDIYCILGLADKVQKQNTLFYTNLYPSTYKKDLVHHTLNLKPMTHWCLPLNMSILHDTSKN